MATTWIIPPGVITAYGGAIKSALDVPAGWAFCDGSAVRSDDPLYANLAQVVGTAFGGDGNPWFNLPNYQGYFLRGVANGSGVDPDRDNRYAPGPSGSSGNSGDNVGSLQWYGVEVPPLSTSFGMQFSTSPSGADAHFGYNMANILGGYIETNPATNTVNLGVGPSSNTNETRPVNAYVNYLICLGVPV
ncbi:MAG TPA: phage tail protein [Longimicrobium sp.]|nr:phage tail protein [Longimicrobium sp.]